MNSKRHQSQRGYALPAALLLLLILSAMAVGMVHMVQTETRVSESDLDSMAAFYGSEAGMEKMMADLSALFINQQAPTVEDIMLLSAEGAHPILEGVTYPEYTFTFDSSNGSPETIVRPIGSGAFEGLVASIIPMQLNVSGRGRSGSEVRMARDIEVALIPVFQFGIFSSTDLSYFPGPGFDFGGRVHTNGDLYLATSNTLTFRSKISAAGDIVRDEMANGISTENRNGTVLIPTTTGGCNRGQGSGCRALQRSEGSQVGGQSNPDWPNLSLSVYKGMITNGDTGAKPLELPFVAEDVGEIEIIRRPPLDEDPTSLLGKSRLYNQSQIRILISDESNHLPGGVGIELSNAGTYYDGTRYGATNTAFAEAGRISGQVAPSQSDHPFNDEVDSSTGRWPAVGGFLQVQVINSDGSGSDVTAEWLDLGIARENPDAILRFQRLDYRMSDGSPRYSASSSNLRRGRRFVPLNMYDTREGEVRDERGPTDCAVGGVMNVVELDVGNLKRWLERDIGLTGNQVDYQTRNGYVLYFSDRRGMLTDDGEYGFEDNINSSGGGSPNGALDAGEDVNGNLVLDSIGASNIGWAFGVNNDDPTIRVDCNTARVNRVSAARHGLRLVNGSLGNVPLRPDDRGGFTVASENPVYILGDYNAEDGFGGAHAAAAVIGDAVTLLSNDWSDHRSFSSPTDPGGRRAAETHYRVAIAAGKNINYDHPGYGGSDTGTDGGTHNFLRYLERWSGRTLHYRGSLISFYYARQAVGPYKCCSTVYSPPTRRYAFDSEFLDPAKLPPGTPQFRELVNLGYQQIFDPTALPHRNPTTNSPTEF